MQERLEFFKKCLLNASKTSRKNIKICNCWRTFSPYLLKWNQIFSYSWLIFKAVTHSSKFMEGNLLNFYKCLPQDYYPYICEKVAIYARLFGSTYILINLNKSKVRNSQTIDNLHHSVTGDYKFLPKYQETCFRKAVAKIRLRSYSLNSEYIFLFHCVHLGIMNNEIHFINIFWLTGYCRV